MMNFVNIVNKFYKRPTNPLYVCIKTPDVKFHGKRLQSQQDRPSENHLFVQNMRKNPLFQFSISQKSAIDPPVLGNKRNTYELDRNYGLPCWVDPRFFCWKAQLGRRFWRCYSELMAEFDVSLLSGLDYLSIPSNSISLDVI